MADPASVVEAFPRLLDEAGLTGKAVLQRARPPTNLGLFASEALAEGAVVFQVPLSLCIVEPRELPPDVARLVPGGVPDSFTWDVRLAVKLMEASLGRRSKFWTEYGRVFPLPQAMSQPALLHRRLQLELQHTAAMIAAEAQQQRLRSLMPELMPAEDAPFEAFPSQLQWAFALTRSRAFSMGDTHFALVPFLDLANHDQVSNVEFQFVPDKQCFYLRTTKRVEPGVELLLQSPPLDNQRMFALHGWVEPGGNPFDQLPGSAGGEAAPPALRLSRKRLWESLRTQRLDPDDLFSLSPYVRAILQSLPLSEGDPPPAAQELQAVAHHQGELEQVRRSDFTTAVEADVQLVQQIKAGDADADPRLLAALLYRVERKTLVATALQLLNAYAQHLQAAA